MRCNYPDCDGGPSTGYCHKSCEKQIEDIFIARDIARANLLRPHVRHAGDPELDLKEDKER